MNSGKVVLGILAGVAVGAALGILFAPDKGSSTRKKILKKGGKYKDDLKKKFNKLIDSFGDKYESLKEEAAQAAENGKTATEKAVTGLTAPRS
jgi:gas vesicle protein